MMKAQTLGVLVALGVLNVSAPSACADPLPDCAHFELWNADASALAAGCRGSAADGSGRSFVAHLPPEHRDGEEVVEVFDQHGVKTQTLREKLDSTIEAPKWEDLDRDGTQELLVVAMTSASNERIAVWRASGAQDQLRRAGELFGVQLEAFPKRAGLVFIRIHGSCCDGVYQLYRFNDQAQLAQVAEAAWSAKSETDYRCDPKPVTGGLSSEETRDLLCARRK